MSVFVAPFVFKEPYIRRFVGYQSDPVDLSWAAQQYCSLTAKLPESPQLLFLAEASLFRQANSVSAALTDRVRGHRIERNGCGSHTGTIFYASVVEI